MSLYNQPVLKMYVDVIGIFRNQYFCWSVTDYDAAIVLYLKFNSPNFSRIRAAFFHFDKESSNKGLRLDKVSNEIQEGWRETYNITKINSDHYIMEMIERVKTKKEIQGLVNPQMLS